MIGEAKPPRAPISQETNIISGKIIDAAYAVHRALGPGLLESVYEICLVHELRKRGLSVRQQIALPVIYDGIQIDAGLRLDLLVEDTIIVELKAVDELVPVHRAQALTYLRLTGHRLALLINFNVPVIKQGIVRIVL